MWEHNMDPVLVNFLLMNIGVPVISEIIKAWQTAHSTANLPTSTDVINMFTADYTKWIAQGQSWLAANPHVV